MQLHAQICILIYEATCCIRWPNSFLIIHPNIKAVLLAETRVFKALSDQNRIRLLCILMHGHRLCVCELSDALELPQYKVSRGLAQLKRAGLVTDQRQGTWIYYGLNTSDARLSALLESLRTYFSAQNAGGTQELASCLTQDKMRLSQRLQLRSEGCCVVGFKARAGENNQAPRQLSSPPG